MSPIPEIKADDCRFTTMLAFLREEKLSASTVYRYRRKDPSFPTPRFGRKFWRPDLLAYCYNIRS